MNAPSLDSFLALTPSRRGHFLLESGHHAELWLDLDSLFSNPRRVAPFFESLTESLRSYDLSVICGPLVGGAFLAQLVAQALGIDFFFTERVTPERTAGMYGARYRLSPAFNAAAQGRRVAIVDDVVSAGSALRATYDALRAAGAVPIVAGTLLLLGDQAERLFVNERISVKAVVRREYPLWEPSECPSCAANELLVAPGEQQYDVSWSGS